MKKVVQAVLLSVFGVSASLLFGCQPEPKGEIPSHQLASPTVRDFQTSIIDVDLPASESILDNQDSPSTLQLLMEDAIVKELVARQSAKHGKVYQVTEKEQVIAHTLLEAVKAANPKDRTKVFDNNDIQNGQVQFKCVIKYTANTIAATDVSLNFYEGSKKGHLVLKESGLITKGKVLQNWREQQQERRWEEQLAPHTRGRIAEAQKLQMAVRASQMQGRT